jgi:hypothetical protein
MMHRTTSGSLALCAAAVICCAPPVKPTASQPAAQLAELWIDASSESRNLVRGPAPDDMPPPKADAQYEVLSRDTAGFSITYKVRGADGREWSVKIGPEAQTEVVSSRIVWAVGYHQVPSFFVERWIAVSQGKGQMLGGGRFRPGEMGLKSRGIWEWQRNPFVGTRPENGLLVLMMILNSTDLKNDNNEVYEVKGEAREDARRWYVVKDLGASLGETGRISPRRGYIEGFEREPFITGVRDGRVEFGFRGRHRELLDGLTVADVRWMCERLQKVTDRQLHDAFRAGNFSDDQTSRYIKRIRAKIDEGLRL